VRVLQYTLRIYNREVMGNDNNNNNNGMAYNYAQVYTYDPTGQQSGCWNFDVRPLCLLVCSSLLRVGAIFFCCMLCH
jgi:hypothetical protein